MDFTGEFRHTIDAKGRLIVPSRLREEIADEEGVVLTVWPDGCISMWSGEGWQALKDQLMSQSKRGVDSRAAVRAFSSQAHRDEPDSQGRISVPQNLRDFAGIDKDVVIVGALDHVELWTPDRYDDQKQRVEEAGGLGSVFEALEI